MYSISVRMFSVVSNTPPKKKKKQLQIETLKGISLCNWQLQR